MPWTLPPLRQGVPADPELAGRRQDLARGQAPNAVVGIGVEEIILGGVRCVVCAPERPTGTLLYFHGGAFRIGAADAWVPFAAPLARAAATRIILVDYGLAPEHPFPAALQDGAHVYDASLDRFGGSLHLGGDSAGGGLALALALAARDAQRPAPAGLLLISPWLDLTVEAASFESCAASDALFSRASAQVAAALYLQGASANHPFASPLTGDLDGLPPILLFASTDEVLRDDAVGLVTRAAAAGVAIEAHFVPGMVHVWPTITPDLAESMAAIEAMRRFLGRPPPAA